MRYLLTIYGDESGWNDATPEQAVDGCPGGAQRFAPSAAAWGSVSPIAA